MDSVSQKSAFKSWLRERIQGIKTYFNVSQDLLPQDEAEAEIRAGVSFRGSQLLILIFAIFVASLGLNTDSIPVIIGAMLISPLMGPIIGMGLGVGIHDYELLKRSAKNVFMAVVGSIVASTIYFIISPQYEGSSQLLARTSPSIYDVFIALFGGAAGIVSIACRNKGQVMPGVAIATSLMPPLCTAGYGLATMQPVFIFGALYLFFTNAVFILFATWIGVKILGYKSVVYHDDRRARHVQIFVTAVVSATIALSVYLTFGMIKDNIFYANADRFVTTEMNFSNTQVLSHKAYVEHGKRYLDVTLIGQALPKDSLQLAMMVKLDSVGLGGTVLNIKQGFSIDSAVGTAKDDDRIYAMMQAELSRRDHEIDSLTYLLSGHDKIESCATEIAPEIRVLFPQVSNIAIGRIYTADVIAMTDEDAGRRDSVVNVAFIKLSSRFKSGELERLQQYLEVRLDEGPVKVVVNHETGL